MITLPSNLLLDTGDATMDREPVHGLTKAGEVKLCNVLRILANESLALFTRPSRAVTLKPISFWSQSAWRAREVEVKALAHIFLVGFMFTHKCRHCRPWSWS